MFTHRKSISKAASARVVCTAVFAFAIIGLFVMNPKSPKARAENATELIEKAMFTRQEFFGSDAVVPLPTSIARENLLKLADDNPGDAEILENLAALNEKLTKFDEAEQCLKKLVDVDQNNTYALADFYERRSRFADEGKELRRILSEAKPANRPSIFARLFDLARTHELKDYLRPEFFHQVISENTDVFPIFESVIDRLRREEEYGEALAIVRQAKTQFPQNKPELLDSEISILTAFDKNKEAETVYEAAFDPFWSDETTEKFYGFLSANDRLREYGYEIKTRFEKKNFDFDAAIRLAHYKSYRSEDITPTILRLEKAKRIWTADELLTVARFLIRENEGDLASRFLYTLYNREDLKQKGDLRARILYQLFELFLDAGDQRLSLTKGDLQFYKQVATIDTNPGIATGILSLIFSDTDPVEKLAEKETGANKYFNRAAAYRVFLEYKQETPASPQLGQMYLDIVHLYAESRDVEIAKATLDEFSARYHDSKDFPLVARELADAYLAIKNSGKSREIYREILDRLDNLDEKEAEPPAANTSRTSKLRDSSFHDHLTDAAAPVTYRDVLERLVQSLSKEKKVPEILELFSAEIKRFPKCEWLYERRLSWLEQTNLTEQQLAAYQEALDRFQSSTWSDKLARWFLRQGRQAEFEKLSTDLVEKLDDAKLKGYLLQFINEKLSANEFQRELYLRLYLSAHRRFPHEPAFVVGLLNFYKTNKRDDEWQRTAAEYYFELPEVRKLFLDDLAGKTKLREFLALAPPHGAVYDLFRADAYSRLSNFEQAVDSYRKLDELYPNTPDFSEPLIALTRSFGQKDKQTLASAAKLAEQRAEFSPSSSVFRTRSGEVLAELGDYSRSRVEWEKLIETASGERQTYLETATVYWDYFQYQDALRTIDKMRKKFDDDALCSFEAGAIRESLHDPSAAITEYLKALDAAGDEEQQERAKKRLTTLSRRNGMMPKIAAAFTSERARRKNPSYFALGYAKFLAAIEKIDEAERILAPVIEASTDTEFLEASLDFYSNCELRTGEQAALKRLAGATESPRRTIAYRLQLAQSFEESHDREKARETVSAIVTKFPLNFGVITAASDLYHRLGFDNDSVSLLHASLSRSRGTYRSELAATLSARLIQLDRLDDAEGVLTKLRSEDKANLDLFRDLAGIYVRKNQPQQLKAAFGETVAALKASGKDRREIEGDIAAFRNQMINAFTRLKDYRSAIEQYIEIINRDPDDEQLTDNAIYYAKRYGGADALLAYYQRTSNESFKNYRWNVVLARIYAAGGDAQNAIRNYRAAIDNQPEMDEFYVATADLEIKERNYEAALKDINTALDLTNEAPVYAKKKIDILKKLGRNAEAEAEKAKLPPDLNLKTADDKFAEAARLQGTEEKDAARKLFREAFEALSNAPLEHEMTAAGLTGYIRSVREQEPLQNIAEGMWALREKLITLADEKGSTNPGEARKRMSILDVAMTETLGSILKTTATDEELEAVHGDLAKRIESAAMGDQHETIGLVRNLCSRAAFGDLEEKVLLRKLDEPNSLNPTSNIRNILTFHNERGAYEKALKILESHPIDDLSIMAVQARLAGDANRELDALRTIYWKQNDKPVAVPSPDVTRFLERIYKENKAELTDLASKPSSYQFQLINFLLGKGERTLSHAAIENSAMPAAWKAARNAETSLALKEFGVDAFCYFCDALQFQSIGEMITQTPDKKRFLVGEDWLLLTRKYGEWLYHSPTKTSHSSLYLTAMTEDKPRTAADQSAIGSFYLGENDARAAVEHFKIALEQSPNDTAAQTDLGVAYYRSGKKDWAAGMFGQALSERSGPEDYLIFWKQMQQYGIAAEARKLLIPKIVSFLAESNVDRSEEMKNLIHSIAASFGDEDEKTAYFREIMNQRPKDRSIAEILITDFLVDESHQGIFFERLISANDGLSSYDYDFAYRSATQSTWSSTDAESVFDQENDYEITDPENERINWQNKLLEVLISSRDDSRAAATISAIEKELNGKYPRPAWLRLAKLHLHVRGGTFDLKEGERFTGISVSDAVSEIKPPDIARFNDLEQMLKDEKHDAEANRLAESFFARNLAFGHIDNANISGLARVFFKKGDTEKAVRLLHLMIEACDETTRPAAIAEISAIQSVKDKAADAAKHSDQDASGNDAAGPSFELASDISAEFGRRDEAIAFRKALLETAPSNVENKVKLAGILAENGDTKGAISLLTAIVVDREAARSSRWSAKWSINELGGDIQIADISFDPFALFYHGLLAKRSNRGDAASFFVNSLVAGDRTEIAARQELVKIYSSNGGAFAALTLAESDKTQKPDELLRILSECAERIEDFSKAIEFEKQRSDGGDKPRIDELLQLAEKAARLSTDMTVDTANTRKP